MWSFRLAVVRAASRSDPSHPSLALRSSISRCTLARMDPVCSLTHDLRPHADCQASFPQFRRAFVSWALCTWGGNSRSRSCSTRGAVVGRALVELANRSGLVLDEGLRLPREDALPTLPTWR